MLKAAGNRTAGNGRAARLSRPCRALPAAAATRNALHLLVAAACWLLPAAAAFAESPSGFPLLDAGKHWPDTNTTLESGSGSLVFFLIAGGALVVLLAAGSFLLRLWLSGRRRQAELLALMDETHLARRERSVLQEMVKAGKVYHARALATSSLVFEAAAAALQRSQRMQALSEANRRVVSESLEVLRQKLSFQPPTDQAAAETAPPAEIRPGDQLTVVHRGQAATMDITVASSGEDALVVDAPLAADCQPGEAWLVRYAREGKMWEFDAAVIEKVGQRVVLSRPGSARFINRRRFHRVPTDQEAAVAEFPLWRNELNVTDHEYVSGKLVEIGGPGLKLQAPLEAQSGQRVLVLLQFSAGEIVEGLGKVRRVSQRPGGQAELAIELIGLNEEEVGRLAQQTNVQEHQAAAQAAEVAAEVEIANA